MSNVNRLSKTSTFLVSNHVMVNEERKKHGHPTLFRRNSLDAIAKKIVQEMASSGKIRHPDVETDIESELGNRPSRVLGYNVGKGLNIDRIHRSMMECDKDKNNILDHRYAQMGMSTASGRDGKVYLCQIFRG